MTPGAPGLLATEADRAALAEVLARPEFRDRRLDALALRRLLLGWWDRLLELLGSAEAERYASSGRLVFLAALLVALLLAWRAVRRRGAAPGRAAPPSPETAVSTTADPLPAEAERALAAGDAPAAIRAAFRAAAAALARRRPGPSGAALTGTELSALAGDPGFDELAQLHDRTVFGRRPAAPEEAHRAVAVALRLAGRAGEAA